MVDRNKYGLSRNIEPSIKRQIRQACGFGCVICGDAIFQYEHIDPVFTEAKKHDPGKMAALCGACHEKVTRGFWSKERVIEARQNPICKQERFSRTVLDISRNRELIVRVGKTEFAGLQSIIEIDGEEILSIDPPEEHLGPPRISARFFDRNDREVASIIQNIWSGSIDAFDMEAKSGRFKINSSENEIDLLMTVIPPFTFQIDLLNLTHKGVHIYGNTSTGFNVELPNASLIVPAIPKLINRAPFWLSIRDEKIALGSECVGKYNRVDQMGYYEIINADAEMVDPAAIGSPYKSDAWKITGREGNGVFQVVFLEPIKKQEPIISDELTTDVKRSRNRHKKKRL